MKVLLTVDPEIPVPPRFYGGIERMVDFLVDELSLFGVKIVLLAHPDSKKQVPLVPWAGAHSQDPRDVFQNMLCLQKTLREHGPFDLIHSFGRIIYFLPSLFSDIPKIQSYQRHISKRSVCWASRLGGSSITFTACSRYLVRTYRVESEKWVPIYNGVRLSNYQFSRTVPDTAPLLFLGRLDRIKGAHFAIQIAKQTGRNLILAGNRAAEGEDARYFEKEIAPHIDDRQIQYVGPVDDSSKNKLLGNASAVLFPIEWNEPCGIVMAEALACGTPVIAFGRGSVPEIIEHGVTGWVGSKIEDLIEGVQRISSLDRAASRKAAETRFSSTVIAKEYFDLYQKVLRH